MYKFFFFLFAIISCFLSAYAEDIIVMRNGDLIKAQVIEITPTEIKYKKATNPLGPTYSENKTNILSITYENGEQDKFETEITSSETQLNINSIYPTADENNAKIITSYNAEYPIFKKKKETNKVCSLGAAYWGISDESIISTDEVEISITRRSPSDEYLLKWDMNSSSEIHIIIRIRNKTSNVLYIDLANTFKSYNYNGDENSSAWYDPTIFSKSSGSGKGVSLGLGAVASAFGIGGIVGTLANGIGIGGGSSSGVSSSTQMERVLRVPPHSVIDLPPRMNIDNNSITYSYENLWILGKNQRDKINLHQNEFRKYSSDLSPFKRTYYITYSFNPDFSNYGTLTFQLYVRALYGCGLNTFKIKDFNLEDPKKTIISYFTFN